MARTLPTTDKRNRFDKVNWLTEVQGMPAARLLEELVGAMSEEEFEGCFNWICQVHDMPRDQAEMEDLLDER